MANQRDEKPRRRATRPEHSEAYWQTIKYVIIGLAILMIIAVLLALSVILRIVPWN